MYVPHLQRDWEAVAVAHGAAFAGVEPANTLVGAELVGCVVQDSNSGHQLPLPPANYCPVFASWTTQG